MTWTLSATNADPVFWIIGLQADVETKFKVAVISHSSLPSMLEIVRFDYELVYTLWYMMMIVVYGECCGERYAKMLVDWCYVYLQSLDHACDRTKMSGRMYWPRTSFVLHFATCPRVVWLDHRWWKPQACLTSIIVSNKGLVFTMGQALQSSTYSGNVVYESLCLADNSIFQCTHRVDWCWEKW